MKNNDMKNSSTSKWETVLSNKLLPSGTKEEVTNKERAFKKAIRNTKSLNTHDMIKRAMKLADEKEANETRLIELYDDNKLKSEKLIKQAEELKKQREKIAARKNNKKEEN